MFDPKDDYANDIRKFLEEIGLDPLYTLTIVVDLIALSYIKDLKRWEKIEDWEKGIVISTFLGAVTFTLASLLRLIGFLKF